MKKEIASGAVRVQAAPIVQKPASKPADNKKSEPAQQVQLTPTGRSAPDTWKEAVNILKKEAVRLYSFLTFGKFAGCDGDLFRWEAPAGQDFYVNALNRDDSRATIADALTRAAGSPCRFEAISAVTVMNTADREDDDAFLRSVTATFGASNVAVHEDQK